MKKSIFLPLTVLLSLFACVFNSCQVGLGPAVDTEPPKISITVPSDSFVVRDNFAMSGTISDDMGVTSVGVVLTNVVTKFSYPVINGTFDNEKGTWNCDINAIEKDSDGNIKYLIKDGVYTATATAKDSFGHEGTATRTFSIDNTAPLVVLKSPTAGDAFGQKLKFSGTVYDSNTVDTIDVVIYTDDGNPVNPTTVTIENASSLNNVTVVDWSADVSGNGIARDLELNDYQKLYGTDKDAGDKSFYFGLNSYDKARRIVDGEADPDDRGNQTKYFYFEEEIYEWSLGSIGEVETHKLLNGTYSAVTDEVAAGLIANLGKSKKNQGYFSLNPDNNPKYVVNNKTFKTVAELEEINGIPSEGVLQHAEMKSNLGSTITVTVNCGLDNNPIMPETLGVYLVAADKNSGAVLTGDSAKTITLLEPYYDYENYEKKEGWGLTSAGKANPGKKYDDEKIKKAQTSYDIALELKQGIVPEGTYWLVVKGYDQNGIYDEYGTQIKDHGNEILNDDDSEKYAYKYAVWTIGSDAAPVIKIFTDAERKETYPQNLNIPKNKELKIYGTATDCTGQYRKLNVKFYKNNSKSDANIFHVISDVSGTENPEDDNFEYTISAADIAAMAGNENTENPTVSGDFTVFVVAEDAKSLLTSISQFTIAYDCTNPVFESVDITPVVTRDDVDYVNGIVTVKANVTDNGILTTWYSADGGTTKVPVEKMGNGFKLDTTVFADNAPKTIKLYAKDAAGNETVKDVILNVKQETDKPVVTLNTADPSIKTAADIATKNSNIFGASNNQLIGTITDDDGFAEKGIEIIVQKIVNGAASGEPVKTYPEKGNISITIPAATKAQYNVTINVTDSKGETGANSKTTVGPFLVVIDEEIPKFGAVKLNSRAYSTEQETFVHSARTVTVEGSVTDDSTLPVSVKRYSAYDADTGLCSGASTDITVAADGKWTDSFTSAAEASAYYYEATDVYGKKAIQTVKYSIDDVKPALIGANTKVGGKVSTLVNEADTWFNQTNLELNGQFQEEGSGIETLKYWISAPDSAFTENPTGILATTDMGTYETFKNSVTLSISSGSDHSKIKLQAIDYAGNSSDEIIYIVKIDPDKPVIGENIKFRHASEADEFVNGNPILTNGRRDITLSSTAEDAASGLNKIFVNVNGTENEIEPAAEWSYTISSAVISALSGNPNIKISASDKAGNISDVLTVTLKIDTTAPVVTALSPKTKAESSKINGLVNFEGKIVEQNTPKSIKMYYKTGSKPTSLSAMTLAGTITDRNELSPWSFKNIDVSAMLAEGSTHADLYVAYEAYDEAGNCNITDAAALTDADLTVYDIDLDSDRPEIKLTNIPKPSAGETTYLTYTKDATLSVSDDDGVEFIKILEQPAEPTAAEWEAALPLTSSNGNYSFNLGADDEKNLWFYVKDNAGGIFYTNKDSKTVYMPKIYYSDADTTPVDNSTAVSFVIDSTAPAFGADYPKFGYAAANDADGLAAAKANLGKIETGSSVTGGTVRKYVLLAAEVSENGSGVSSVTADFNGVKAMTQTGGTGLYYSPLIDVSGYSDGSYTITFTATDNSGIKVQTTKNLIVDNSAPSSSLISPSDKVTGTITLTGTTLDEHAEVAEVKYVIGSNDVTSVADALSVAEGDGYTSALAGGTTVKSWKFVLDGTANPKLPASDAELAAYSTIPHDAYDIYTLPVYIYAKDSLGNRGITETAITYNPFGDRPVASVTYPAGEWTDAANTTGYSNISGSIRVTGAAEDNEAIGNGKVYIQIDINNDGSFDETDLAALKTMEADGAKIYTIVEKASAIPGQTDVSSLGDDGDDFWGILVNGTNSWNYTINTNNELQTSTSEIGGSGSGRYKAGIRAIAMDNNGVLGKWSAGNYFMIDLNAPSIDSSSIVNPDDETEIATEYADDMYLKGTKSLRLKISDVKGLKNVKYTYATTIEGINSSTYTGTALLETPDYSAGKYVYTVDIPLSEMASTLNSTSVAVKVTATKNSDTETTSYEKYNVYFDNTAPVINNLTLNSVKYEQSDKKIVNSNGYFTIGGSASDDGAGFERMSFYFMRTPGTTINETRIYDPMIAPDPALGSTAQPNYINVETLTKYTVSIDTGDYDMYGAVQSAGVSGNNLTMTSTDAHIREGGYVAIGGTYNSAAGTYTGGTWHKISSITGTSVTLATPTTATGTKNVFFPYMQSIDNTGTEKSDGLGGVASGDDGDTMPESIIKSQATWSYDASFFSNYIPDGPGKLVTFVYDKAGNVSAQSYDVSVQNKAPRLTKLWLATDLNNSGDFEDVTGTTELIEYNVLGQVGEQTNYATMKTKDYRGERFIIKNQMAVIPEFTNGNGNIYMAMNNNPGSDKTPTSLDPETYTTQAAATAALYNTNASKVPALDDLVKVRNDDTKWAYIIANDKLGSGSYNTITKEFENRAMSFTFWDSTEDTISGVNSNYCYLKITDLVVNVEDLVGPNVAVSPFFWNSHEDNSLYKNSYRNGHIDIVADEDPKVSGKISIRGTAFDDHTLGSIWVKFDKFTPANTVYDGSIDDDGYYKVASYNGAWTSYAETDEVDGNKWNFTVTPDYLGQKGHKVNWQLDIDTSAITGAMANDMKVYVRALDAADHISSAAANGTEIDGDDVYNKPNSQMDVVPYIIEVKDANGNAANRSRLGRYPVQAGAEILLSGFNFKEGNISASRTKTGGEEGDGSLTVSYVDSKTIKVTAPNYSGFINLTIDGITVSNNTNANTTYNIQKGFVASEAETYGAVAAARAGKDFWTDDVYLSVWNVGGTLTDSLLPVNGTIENFDSQKGKIFNGSINYQYVTAAGSNRTYGIYGSNAKMMYNGWFQNGADRLKNLNYQANTSYKLPPAEVDTCIVGDKPMYVVLDNGIDGSGTWSSGLYCAIDGWQIPQSASQVKPIEMQGNGANDNPDSSDGMDDILFQFRNPKIAGYKVSDNEYYAYVSYYDSYARCLKYSKFKFTGTGENDKTPVVAMYGNEKSGIAVVDGYDTLNNDFSGAGWDCGEFSDIKVDGTIPVIAYFSNSSSTTNGGSGKVGLRIARGSNTAPKTYRVDGTTTVADYANEWIYTDVSTPAGLSDFGRYVSMEMDSSGGLHIIAQGTSNSTDSYELWYMYLTKKDDGHYTKTVEMKVDATSSVGRYTDIKLGKTSATGLQCYPTVTYMDEAHLNSTRAVKVAYLDNVTSPTTGVWECMTDPASYAATNQKLSIVLNTYDNLADPIKNKLAVGINSDLFVIDCLRNEDNNFTSY